MGEASMARPEVGLFKMPAVGREYAETLAMARGWLAAMIERFNINNVCFESPFISMTSSGVSVRQMCAMAGIIELTCMDLSIPCREVTAMAWRSRFIVGTPPKGTKRGYARRKWYKEQAKRSCAIRSWPVSNDDEADACGILDYVLACDFPDYGAATGAPLLALKGA